MTERARVNERMARATLDVEKGDGPVESRELHRSGTAPDTLPGGYRGSGNTRDIRVE